jgi:hypothetical protein
VNDPYENPRKTITRNDSGGLKKNLNSAAEGSAFIPGGKSNYLDKRSYLGCPGGGSGVHGKSFDATKGGHRFA